MSLVTPDDIDKERGIRGSVETERFFKKINGASLNFTREDGGQLLSVVIQIVNPEDLREEEKTRDFQDLYYGPVKDLGDKAYEGPAKGDRYILSFLKGSYWITLSSYLTIPSLKPIFDQNDLRKLANIMISRISAE